MRQLNDENFDNEIGPDKTVVMFTAQFAGPCNLALPVYTELANNMCDEVVFSVFDLDGNPNIPERYGVKQLPLFVLFLQGLPVDLVAGAVPYSRLEELVKNN